MRCLAAQRLKWWGDLRRLEEYRKVRRIFECSPMGKRSKGYPRNRWQGEVMKEIRVDRLSQWRPNLQPTCLTDRLTKQLH